MGMNEMSGLLIVVSGPSGVGKGTICRELLKMKPGLKLSISATTRLPRPGEVDGESYIFMDEDNFKRLIKEDYFLEWAYVHGHFYGTPRSTVKENLMVGQDLLLEIDVNGALQVKESLNIGELPLQDARK